MPSTYSSLLRLELMQTGEKSATWGNITNINLGTLLEKGIAGTATIDVTAGNVTLTALNGADDQARCLVLLVTGSPGAARTLTAPSSSKMYVVLNTTSVNVTIKGAATPGVLVPAGDRMVAVWDGSDFVRVGPPTDSPTFTGTTTVDTLLALGATTIGNAPGDTLTIAPGSVSWSNNPTHSGNHTFSGTAAVQGALTANGALIANGNTTLGNAVGDTLNVAGGSLQVNATGAVGVGVAPSSGARLEVGGDVHIRSTNRQHFTDSLNSVYAYAPASNEYAIGTNSTDRIRVDSSGNVGIGAAPLTPLHVNSSVQNIFRLETTRARGAGGIYSEWYDTTGRKAYFGCGDTNSDNFYLMNETASAGLIFGTNAVIRGIFLSGGGFVVGASSRSAIGVGTDTLATAGTLGISGAQINVNPAADFEMVHRSTGGWWFYTDSATKAPFKIDRLAPTDSLQLTSSGVKIGGDGRLYGLNLHNNAGSVTGTTNQYVASGTYTPSASAISGVSAVSAAVAQWIRVGNVVTVSGECTVDPTGVGTNMRWTLSLPPVGATVSATNACCGTASGQEAGGVMLVAKITGGSSLAVFDTRSANDNASYNWSYTYTFLIS